MAVSFDQFQQLDIVVGEVSDCRDHPNADNLLLLDADVGEEDTRQLVAGLKGHYTTEELVGKSIVVIINLEPAEIRGEESEGMLLAADGSEVISLLEPDQDVTVGTPIR